MIVSKHILIESVLREVNIDDVLSGKHYDDVQGDVNSTEKYQEEIKTYRIFLNNHTLWLKKDPKNIDQWVFMMINEFKNIHKTLSNGINTIKKFFESYNVQSWAQKRITDEHIVNSLGLLGYDNLKPEMKKHSITIAVHIDLAYILEVMLRGSEN
jgi:hypothetical protein